MKIGGAAPFGCPGEGRLQPGAALIACRVPAGPVRYFYDVHMQSPRQARAGMEEEDSNGGREGSSTAAGNEPAQQQGEPRLLKREVQPLAGGVDALELDADHCPRCLQTCTA